MNERFELSPELAQLERRLQQRPRPDAVSTTSLRQRVLDAARQQGAQRRANERWTFAAAIAAVLLLGLNLTMTASTAIRLEAPLSLVTLDRPTEAQWRAAMDDLTDDPKLQQTLRSLRPTP